MIDDLVEYIVRWLEGYTPRWNRTLSEYKAITTLFVYATRREQDGDPRLLAAFLNVGGHFPHLTYWVRYRIGATMSELLEEESSNLQKRAAVLAAPSMPQSWKFAEDKGGFINSWLSAVDRVKEMGGVTEGAVRVSFDMAWDDEWRPHMTSEAWALLKWGHQGRHLYWKGEPLIVGNAEVIPAVRSLGDVEILTSFLILTWLGLDSVSSEMTDQICIALWEEYGIGKDVYRGELLRCLDRILEHFDRMQYGLTSTDRLWYLGNDSARSDPVDFIHGGRPGAYMRLKKELLDVERAAVVAHTSRLSGLLFSPLLIQAPQTPTQAMTHTSCVPCHRRDRRCLFTIYPTSQMSLKISPPGVYHTFAFQAAFVGNFIGC